ncbi:MAG: ABC transporter substrate-binding protein [Ignavibacteriae bacterium]|nr:ABC transporter substrate-binding protein [Ignavibacteriota bacterium]MCB9214944.1 ABC transporter substrate-binding protein [Ignavibacteria bacterium]
MRRAILILCLFCSSLQLLRGQDKIPVVPPELGGPGFEKIAAQDGWESGDFLPEDFPYLADERAVKGGSISLSITDFPITFRAYGKDENSQITRLIHGFVYEPLITVNPLTLEFAPALASHWKVGDDGQTFWFRIDPRARFSDGTPVTTEDVVATYDLALDPRILSPYTNTFYEGFDPPEAVSPYIFKVRGVGSGWKNLLYFGGTSILPAHVIGHLNGDEYIEEYNYTMPTGSGPYEVKTENVRKGRAITLTRRKDWWRKDDPIFKSWYNFDSITFVVVVDERLQLEKFKKGKFDLYLITRAQWYEEEFNDEPVNRGLIQKRKIYNDEPQGVSGLVFNMRKPPFDNPKVREAFTYLFNREGLVKNLMYGQYLMTNSYYPGSVYENPNNPKVTYNPEKGAALLVEAGYTTRNKEGILEKDGKPLVIEMPIVDNWVRVMTPVQQEWKKAGIKLEFRQVDYPIQFKLLNERNFDIAFMSWGGLLYPNPKSSFHSELADIPNTNNLAGFKNRVADSLINLELVTFDLSKRVQIIRQLDSILVASHQYALAWYAPFTRVAYWNKFGHPDFYIGRTSDWRSILSLWWYDPDKAALVERGKDDPTMTLPTGSSEVYFWKEYEENLDSH